ncbi:MAG: 50S ribosomal protein L9 [Xanthomonadales bacterium]|nr:50S ribosomal protein L9 [Xanthomonadales bacterium]
MDLILLENIQNLGKLGDVVKVKPGFGRNFLVPQGKAVPATKSNLEAFETRRAELEARAADRLAAATARRDAVADQTVTITANASSEGKLYGSVGTREIAEALTGAGFPVEKSEVLLPEGAIRMAGEYDIDLHFYAEVDCQVKLAIVGEES